MRATAVDETLVSLVRDRAGQTPEAMAFAFLQDGGQGLAELSCAGLEREARRVATLVSGRVAPGGRAILVYEPGLDFLGAFFGCLFAGVTAIPVYPPFPRQLEGGLARLARTLRDADAHAVLVSEALAGLSQMMPGDRRGPWIVTNTPGDGDPDAWQDPGTTPEAIAVMQYTSGSTAEPRGVVLRHEHILANLGSIDWFLGGGAAHGASVSWLPTYHDMGLVGGVIYNLSRGRPTYLLSPLHFLKHPAQWLELVSRVRATVTGGPNFALELCVRRVSEDERAALDLSCLDIVFNGAEPIQAESVRRFETAFAGCGLRPGVVLGCYGLAEASLLITGARRGARRFVTVDRQELERGRAAPPVPDRSMTQLVSSGGIPPRHDVRIVDPVTRAEMPRGRVGEIWFRGPSVAAGYWCRAEETEAAFDAELADAAPSGARYLRTGDLGFLLDDQLFVSGRLKDLIVERGRNIQPHDVELAAQGADPRIRPGRGVAFGVQTDRGEGVALLQETSEEDPEHLEELAGLIRRVVVESIQVHLAVVYLVPARTILTTANGKLQRGATRAALEAGEFDVLHESRRGAVRVEAIP